MDIATANRIYDEVALTVGMRLCDLGETLDAAQIDILATDVDRDAGVDLACSLGRLALDSDDQRAIWRAKEAQKDRIRSIISMHAPQDPAFFIVQQRDMFEAKLRLRLIKAYMDNDRKALFKCYETIMVTHEIRRTS